MGRLFKEKDIQLKRYRTLNDMGLNIKGYEIKNE